MSWTAASSKAQLSSQSFAQFLLHQTSTVVLSSEVVVFELQLLNLLDLTVDLHLKTIGFRLVILLSVLQVSLLLIPLGSFALLLKQQLSLFALSSSSTLLDLTLSRVELFSLLLELSLPVGVLSVALVLDVAELLLKTLVKLKLLL